MRIYIAGPMSGMPDWNFPLFFETQRVLEGLGHEVENPADNDGPTLEAALAVAGSVKSVGEHAGGATWASYLKRDLPRLCRCDAVCVLPGWQQSKGASLEVHVAQQLRMPIMILTDEGLAPRFQAIGLAGYARTGKDTAAGLLKRYGYTQMAFAGLLKEAVARVDPILGINHTADITRMSDFAVDGVIDYEMVKLEFPDEARGLWQNMGTEVGRNLFGETFWLDQTFRQIPDGAKVVFSDVRFPNEADAIKAVGGHVWRLVRPGFVPANGHISETAMDRYPVDSILYNAGTVDELDWHVAALLHFHGLSRAVEDTQPMAPVRG